MSDGSEDYQARARELLALVKEDPAYVTKACRNELLKLQQKGEKDLNHLVMPPYGLALYLLTNPKAWAKYISSRDLWKHRKKKPRRDVDHGRVLSLVFEATLIGLKGYGPSWYYARALEHAFIKGIKPEELPAYIEANGSLKQLYQAALRDYPRRKPGRDASDPYFVIDDPKPEVTDESQDGDEGEAGDPGPKPDTSTDEPEGAAPDVHKLQIEPSTGLVRKLEKIMQEGRTKRLMIIARPQEDGVVLRLPKKSSRKQPSLSSWPGVRIMPDSPDLPDCAYAVPRTWALLDEPDDDDYYHFQQEYYYGGPNSSVLPHRPDDEDEASTTPEKWSAVPSWEHPDWKR